MNKLIQETDKNYSKMVFKEALRTGFYEFQVSLCRVYLGPSAIHTILVYHFVCMKKTWSLIDYKSFHRLFSGNS